SSPMMSFRLLSPRRPACAFFFRRAHPQSPSVPCGALGSPGDGTASSALAAPFFVTCLTLSITFDMWVFLPAHHAVVLRLFLWGRGRLAVIAEAQALVKGHHRRPLERLRRHSSVSYPRPSQP